MLSTAAVAERPLMDETNLQQTSAPIDGPVKLTATERPPQALRTLSVGMLPLANAPIGAVAGSKKKKHRSSTPRARQMRLESLSENAVPVVDSPVTPPAFPSNSELSQTLSPLLSSTPFRAVEAESVSHQPRLLRAQTAMGVLESTPTSSQPIADESIGRTTRALSVTSPFSRVAEQQRWDDVVRTRERNGQRSPLKIYVNPLRLFEPERIQRHTGHAPAFDVVLEDPFAATPDRRLQRSALNKRATHIAFDSGCDVAEADAAPRLTPRALPVDANISFTHVHPATVPEPTLQQQQHQKRGPTLKKKKMRRNKGVATPRASTFHPSTPHAASLMSEVEMDPEGRAPRWASLNGMVEWVLAEGDAEARLTLALTYRHVMKATALETMLEELFVSDSSVDRRLRRGALAFVAQWVDVMRFHSPDHYQDALLEALCNFARHTADLHEKMTAQRHTQASLYAGSKELARTLTTLRQQIGTAFNVRATRDDDVYYVNGRLRDDADAVALRQGCLAWSSEMPLSQSSGSLPMAVADSSNDTLRANAGCTTSTLLKLDPRKLAAALTHVDGALFSEITGYDLLRGARNGPAVIPNRVLNKRRVLRINHIVTITAHWNTLSRWVPSCVLAESDVKLRAKLLKRFIKLAVELKALNNWSAFFALMIGLGSGTLSSLKDSWRMVPAKHTALFRELEEWVQPMGNFQRYRSSVAECAAAGVHCIPYMAIVLKDFQAVEEGNPTRDHRGWINWQKLELLAATLKRVRAMQAIPCPLRFGVDRKYVTFVTAQLASRGESELWEQSKAVKQSEAALASQMRTSRW